jgi:serine/threonine-protein kinase
VASGGDLYITDDGHVMKLAAGATAPTVLLKDLNIADGVAVDNAGNLYVADHNNQRVLKLAAGASTPTELPFTGLERPQGVAVDSAGDIYVTDFSGNRVLKLAAGASAATVLSFAGLDRPDGVAVDTAGNVYVTDFGNDRVLKLAAGTSSQTVLPFTGIRDPDGVAVDTDGNVYVTDFQDLCAGSKPPCFSTEGGRVLKLAPGASTPTVLPLTGLSRSGGVAVDDGGSVYVTDTVNDRVLKLPAQ